jgi:hypothetical protein
MHSFSIPWHCRYGTMEAAAFVAGVGVATGAIAYYREKKRAAQRDAITAFEKKSATGIVKAPFTVGDPTEVEHFTVPHLKEYFQDIEEFER